MTTTTAHHKSEERRSRVLTDADIEAIRESMCGGVDGSMHVEHHRLFSEWLKREEVKRERREKIIQQVTGWGFVAALGSIGTFFFHLLEKYIQDIASRGGH